MREAECILRFGNCIDRCVGFGTPRIPTTMKGPTKLPLCHGIELVFDEFIDERNNFNNPKGTIA